MEKHTSYFNILDALKEDGCSICSLVKKTIRKVMEDFLYENVNDPGSRKEIRKSIGFCNTHAWQLQRLGDGLGSSIIYEDLINIALSRLEKVTLRRKNAEDFLKEFLKEHKRYYYQKPNKVCPLCKTKREVEERYILTFIEGLQEEEFYSSFKDSFGLCLSHLLGVLKKCKEGKTAGLILRIELGKMRSLIGELKEFQRKHDYRFSHEGFGKEGDSWIRAIEKMVGKDGMF